MSKTLPSSLELGSNLAVEVRTLEEGHHFTIETGPSEYVIVILTGTCSVKIESSEQMFDHLGGRTSVFDGVTTSVYLPKSCQAYIEANSSTTSVALVSAHAHTEREAYVIMPNEVRIEHRGQASWQREVHTIITDSHKTDALIVGETFSTTGVWSAYPPHRHDLDQLPNESNHDEIFYFRIEPDTGFAVQVSYETAASPKQASIIQHEDFLSVNEGYHSFVAAAGHKFYYLWALAGKNRNFVMHVDEQYDWLE
ncbi:5-deoxy-glucuronate isomerase [Paenibacillus shirakamiensis]|uniref:5-deoxy-glucuronate isomerase n=1 Tax=Paenibacillus shirakamiensis TaxID=1265935 RepID=A0ABS4JE30_9BACL|nr:5-deoxy-glucuronate isomerase [Paenibacillus shirakamiensis]MBP1999935.1 5-deoxy-glucuronate isomerase [Paenibacillus shirakamiensis]